MKRLKYFFYLVSNFCFILLIGLHGANCGDTNSSSAPVDPDYYADQSEWDDTASNNGGGANNEEEQWVITQEKPKTYPGESTINTVEHGLTDYEKIFCSDMNDQAKKTECETILTNGTYIRCDKNCYELHLNDQDKKLECIKTINSEEYFLELLKWCLLNHESKIKQAVCVSLAQTECFRTVPE